MNMTSAKLKAKGLQVEPVVNNKYRVIFCPRPYGFIDGAIYEVSEINKVTIKLKGYGFNFLKTQLTFYPI